MLKDRVILISGASSTSGVGSGVVEAMLEAGGQPIINGRDARKLDEVKERFPNVATVLGDISIAADVERLMTESVGIYGRVDGLVNNAGIGLHKAPHLCEESDFDRLIAVDFRGTWLLTRAWLRHILDGGEMASASAVNISSVHAQKTMPGYGLYSGVKGAVDAFTRGLAVHYGRDGLRFNAVAPGYVQSDQNIDLLRNWTDSPEAWVDRLTHNHQATPEAIRPIDVGRVVAFLLSDQASAVTGQTLTVDAGNTSLLFPLDFV